VKSGTQNEKKNQVGSGAKWVSNMRGDNGGCVRPYGEATVGQGRFFPGSFSEVNKKIIIITVHCQVPES